MKRLLTIALLALTTLTSSGCWHWFNRGASCNTCAPAAAPMAVMSAPVEADCGFLGTPGAMQVVPGPVQ